MKKNSLIVTILLFVAFVFALTQIADCQIFKNRGERARTVACTNCQVQEACQACVPAAPALCDPCVAAACCPAEPAACIPAACVPVEPIVPAPCTPVEVKEACAPAACAPCAAKTHARSFRTVRTVKQVSYTTVSNVKEHREGSYSEGRFFGRLRAGRGCCGCN